MPVSNRHGLCATGLALWLVAIAGPAPAQPGATSGAEIWTRAGCAGCHGPHGAGTAIAPALAATSLELVPFTSAVRTARGAMPAYGVAALPDDVVAELHAYLASLPASSRPSGRAGVGSQRYEEVGCYSCHSNQGQGGTQGPRLGPRPARWDRFAWYVRHPSGQMPPYTEAVLSDQDLADVYAFLESRPTPRPLSDIPLLAP